MGRIDSSLFMDAKGRFRFGKLDHSASEAPVAQIGAQHAAAFAVTRPVVPFGAPRPFESQASRQVLVVDEADRIARGGARVAAEQAADLTLGAAAVDRLLRPLDASLQARQGGLDALAEARVFLLLSLG